MGNQKDFMTQLVTGISQMEEFGPETLALAFASRGNFKENYGIIKTLLENAPRDQWQDLLVRGGSGSLINTGKIDETSVLGTMFMTMGALRTHKLSGA